MTACLNRHTLEPDELRVLILSTPKTGNTWLRWLLHYAYDLPIVNLPREWDAAAAAAEGLPRRFVSHQHLVPSEGLLRWLLAKRVTVITTVRHPGDTFLSLFHYVKWQHDPADRFVNRLRADVDRPGPRSLEYLHQPFPQVYSLSDSWADLSAIVVRYEDLLADPCATLRTLASSLGTIDTQRLEAAVLLCKPDLMSTVYDVDARHLRSADAGGWVGGLPPEHRQILATLPVYRELATRYGYDWDESRIPVRFDYGPIDPFGGRRVFDNGERVTPGLVRIYLQYAGEARTRWPDPTLTEGDSFWNWLQQPCEAALAVPTLPPESLTNVMWCVHRIREDLQRAYPQPATIDRLSYAQWFLGQAHTEFGVPWSIVQGTRRAFGQMLTERVLPATPGPGRV